MSVNIHFDTGSLSSEEATGLSAFIAAVQPALLSTAQLREYNRGLYSGAAAVAMTTPATTALEDANALTPVQQSIKDGTFSVRSATDEERAAIGVEAPKRERGKPAPGRARRTKEEIAEDEAADAADAAAASEKPAMGIQTGGERINPEEAAQDAADEAAEDAANTDPEKPLTLDDVKNAVGEYVAKFGMEAAQGDGPGLFVDVLGNPPEGNPYWKFSILPSDQASIAKLIAAWKAAAAAPARYKRRGA